MEALGALLVVFGVVIVLMTWTGTTDKVVKVLLA
jgi:hypothetical protein